MLTFLALGEKQYSILGSCEKIKLIFDQFTVSENTISIQTFSKVARLVIVPELQGFIDASRCTAWYSSPEQAYECQIKAKHYESTWTMVDKIFLNEV